MKEYFEIIKIISDELALVDNGLKRIINSFQGDFVLNFSDFVLENSKKIRSVTTILFLKSAFGKVTDRQIKICALTELLHNASLIHDDVVDNSDTRRGKPSFKSLYGSKKAVLTGDFLLSLCLKELADMNNTEIVQIFANSMANICNGELFQLENLGKIPSLEDYLLKSEQKTAELFKTALICSLICENQSDYAEKAAVFATNFGIAFQIYNDLQNVLGKKENSDLENGIYTAPVIFSQNPSNALDGIEKTTCLLNNYVSKAKNAVSDFKNSDFKDSLLNLLELYGYE
ncbi:MAG: polyprenyl synthetase family protein [Candidatus Gastranaerophilales bacterium]|nr:polyprenyl synthetase family protein [Candidatus Gastranaerophilales bacterium]